MTGPTLQLYPYQQKWFQDRSRFKLGMFARQTGKTFTTSAEIVDDCAEAWADQRRSPWLILSRGERQAKEAMDEGVKLHAKAYQMAIEEWSGEISINGFNYRALEVTLPGGQKITAVPANPDTARGYSRNTFLDEFAIHKDSREVWGALFPVVSKGGLKLRVTSTPKGKGNMFYQLATGTDDVWSRHFVDIYQAVAQGLDRNIEELRAGLMDEELWAQEFELKWLDDAYSWLSWDLIMAAEDPDAGDPELYQGGRTFIGNDIARRNDLWVAVVLEEVGDVLWERERVELKTAAFSQHDTELDRLVETYNPVRIAMDQTGMGEKPVEDAQRRYGSLRVEGVLLTSGRRLDVATAGKQSFQDHKVRIPAGDPVLRADLHKMKMTDGATGHPRLVADSDSQGHADRTWAYFLALAAASGEVADYGYRPAISRRMANAARFGEVDLEEGSRFRRPDSGRFGRGAW